MQCVEFERRMQELLDLRLPPEQDAVLLAHAAACAACSHRLELQSWLLEQLQRDLHTDPPLTATFAQNAVLRLTGRRPDRPNVATALQLATAGAASCALITLAAWPVLFRADAFPRPAAAIVAADVPAPDARPMSAAWLASPPAEFSNADRWEPRNAPPSRGGTGFHERPSPTLPAVSPPWLGLQILQLTRTHWYPRANGVPPGGVEIGSPAGLPEQSAWVARVSSGLRPLTDSVTSALGVLRRVLPGTAESATAGSTPQA
jgi:hypothetical protein